MGGHAPFYLPGLVFYLFLSYLLTNSFDGMTIVKFVLQTLYLSNLIPSNYLSIIPRWVTLEDIDQLMTKSELKELLGSDFTKLK